MGTPDTAFQRKQNTKKPRNYTPYGFLLPSVITILVVILFPFLMAIYISVNQVNLVTDPGKFFFKGVENFIALTQDSRVSNSIWVTIKYVVGVVMIETLLGLAIALFLNRNFRGKSLVRTMIILPMFITPVVVALIWRMFYDPTSGILNWGLGVLGLGSEHDWLGNPLLALLAIIVVDVWQWTPFMVLIIMAGLDSLPLDIYEAAYVDGASELQMIRYITLPLILPSVFIAVVLRTIDALKAFDLIWVMTQGGPGLATETTNLYSYIIGFKYFRIGYATSLALVFTISVTICASIVVNKAFKRVQSL